MNDHDFEFPIQRFVPSALIEFGLIMPVREIGEFSAVQRTRNSHEFSGSPNSFEASSKLFRQPDV
jgi:hypothetical protein